MTGDDSIPQAQTFQPSETGGNNDIVDGVTGKVISLDSGDSGRLVKVKVTGKAFYRREPQPDQNPMEVPMKRYKKGAELLVSERTLREAPNMLAPLDPHFNNPNAFIVSITDVGGIGRSASRMLSAAGIITLEDLSAATALVVASAANVTERNASEWISEAKDLVRDVKAELAGTSEDIQGSQAGLGGDLEDDEEYRRQMNALKPQAGATIRQAQASGGEYTGNVAPNETPPGDAKAGVTID